MLVVLLAAFAMTVTQDSCAVVRVPLVLEASEGLDAVGTSLPIDPGLEWDEAIPSWNVTNSDNARLEVQIQGVVADRDTKWYDMALWHGHMARGPRTSIPSQSDADAEVLTDVLRNKSGFRSIRVRVRLHQVGPGRAPELKLLTVCFSNRAARELDAEDASPRAEVLAIDVPQLAQGTYEFGKLDYPRDRVSPEFEEWFRTVTGAQYCSPTSVAMVLKYWSAKLGRPDLDVSVPEVVAGVFDSKYPGTGNWPFNTAYMGSFSGSISYVSRLRGMADLEELVRAGIPTVCSVAYNLVLGNGKPPGGDGHLVLVVGFDSKGNPIVNDPGKSDEVRRTFVRADFAKGWATSGRTVYLCYPEKTKLPSSLASTVLR